jgi:ATP-dependent DNA helicase RecQ
MIHEILKKYWGYDKFRPLQEEIIQATIGGHDTLVLLPTGGGKSLCFQVPALAMNGVCIVVTPLIALMKDQVEQLKRRGIKAAAIHTGMNWHEIDITLDNCIHGGTKFLYLSPERLKTEIFLARLKLMNVCLLAVDEAHCISQWGYDFRPAYLKIAELRPLIPKVPLIALTASATETVKVDIAQRLELKSAVVFQATFARPNLSYSAFFEENKESRLLKILQNVPGTAIVYVRSRKRTQELANWLMRHHIKADCYHAGLTTKARSQKQEAWLKNQIRVIVATNAFGMGIDKADVRAVVHLDLPDSLEAYYQEAGRAGRDSQKAYSVALFSNKDLADLKENVERKYPELDFVRRVYQALANYFKIPIGGGEFDGFDFDMQSFAGTFGLPVMDTHYALKLLQEEGFIQLSEHYFSPSKIYIVANQKELYDMQLKNPTIDTFIKLIMRMYGGELFTNFVTISETAIAHKHYTPEPEVIQILTTLHQKNVIIYEKQRDKPQLTYLTPRYDANLLPMNVLQIEEKKSRDVQRATAMTHYVAHDIRCRTLMLQHYFGEKTDDNCGICDNCLKAKQKKQDNPNVIIIEKKILELLALSSLTPNQLVASFGVKNEAITIEILKELLADEKIVYQPDGNMALK